MLSRYLINRGPELRLLDDLLRPAAPWRILLLQAESGLGKSLLLEEYQARIEARGHDLAVVDLGLAGTDSVTLLSTLCHQWDWKRFPRYRQALEQVAGTTVDVHGVVQVGRVDLRMILPEHPAQRKALAAALTEAWFEDARAWMANRPPAVVLIDTYNLVDTPQRRATVDAELHAWVEDAFLAQVHRTAGMRLVLAGQQVPERGLTAWERCCHRHILGPIPDPNDWWAFAQHVGAKITREMVSAYCHTEGGHPSAIATRLTMLRTWSVGV